MRVLEELGRPRSDKENAKMRAMSSGNSDSQQCGNESRRDWRDAQSAVQQAQRPKRNMHRTRADDLWSQTFRWGCSVS